MSDNAIPSHDPANAGGLAGTLREVFKKLMQGVDDMLPARIVAYDRKRNVATVQPQVMVLTTENRTLSRPPLASVPVLALGGGGFVMSFPLKPGDSGWIKASDRDISLYMQSGNESGPNTQRLHSFADGLFIPDVMRGYTLSGEDEANAVLQSSDGSVRVALWPDKLKLTAPMIELDAADVNCTGNLTTEGRVTGKGGVTFGKTPAETHRHDGVQRGSDTSGGPV
ncbi:Gp138 family membrane-puncturing spike protein [Ralstonia syzygii]|uniref:Gp138 family membrane-puncturing spike protein n=1 Tax=Ralstonia syzygii TaxID=28097 RepID=UPI0018D0874D|nr:Gp138 family membrane-puncturing spike protein [Ralstonia syzygii]